VWFRRDLRLHDHAALARAVQDGDAIAPMFVVDDRLVDNRCRSPTGCWFLRGSLEALADGLAARGAPLTVLRGDPTSVVPAFARAIGAGRVIVGRHYSPSGRCRDGAVARALDHDDRRLSRTPDVLVQDPEAVRTADGG